ncbi:Carnosine N-methyltransferase [Ascochyta rabiei]|uniref:carnosine N-methyltransferase n=1 Tax=Didymella rabiei TaxID=5454 RepID=A0A162Z809_DIDRA|nr:Carnosine N-methyltransferase [Ascochyta rabiei]KZM20453.1 methyltransferase [Ascochyta rabiei]UPX16519.1 Carnosine N-methyltransferase [Ascochyta rabiei]
MDEVNMETREWEGDFDPLSDPEEKQHLLSVLDSFRSYRRLAHFNGTHVRRQAFYSLPQKHWTLLSKPPFSVLESLNKMDDLIDRNSELAEAIFMAGFKGFIAPTIDSDWVASIVPERHAHDEYRIFSIVMDNLKVQTTQNDMDKARSCINQFYRDWSAEGSVEREKCFGPVLEVLHAEFACRLGKAPDIDRSDLKVLVPGAGLGRSVFDICQAGFSVEGNEISYHELMASSLILNHTQRAGEFTIAPFALSCSNHLSRADQFQTFAVPDVHPGTALATAQESKLPAHERMSMSTGDFCVLYNSLDYSNVFDVVATVFFIDTAPNVIRYIEAVRNCLKTGGLWINVGPLLWHQASQGSTKGVDSGEKQKHTHVQDAGIGDPGSVELTNDEVLALVEHLGFTVEKQESNTPGTGYISNPRSMLQNTYRPVFWVARKM